MTTETAAATPRERTKKRLPGRPPKSGARALSKFIRRNLLDRRTWVSHEVEATSDRYAADAGGWENLSNRERDTVWLAAGLFVELCVRQQARLVSLAQGDLEIDDSDKHYGWLFNSYSRIMDKLGLRPDRADKTPSLQEYLAARASETAGNGHQDAQDAAVGDDRDGGGTEVQDAETDGEPTP